MDIVPRASIGNSAVTSLDFHLVSKIISQLTWEVIVKIYTTEKFCRPSMGTFHEEGSQSEMHVGMRFQEESTGGYFIFLKYWDEYSEICLSSWSMVNSTSKKWRHVLPNASTSADKKVTNLACASMKVISISKCKILLSYQKIFFSDFSQRSKRWHLYQGQ